MPKNKRQDNAGRGRASTRGRASSRGRALALRRAPSRLTTCSSTHVITPSITADSRSATGGGQPPATGLQPSSSGHSADYDGAVLQQTSPDISSVGSLPLEQLLSVVRAQVRQKCKPTSLWYPPRLFHWHNNVGFSPWPTKHNQDRPSSPCVDYLPTTQCQK